MKLSNKIVEDVVVEVAGEDVIPLVKALKNKKNVSEFKLADNIKQEVNATRNMLYRLYDANLVSFIRKKDKKKGWYIYYWTYSPQKMRFLYIKQKKKKLEQLTEQLKEEEEGQYFECKSKCVRLNFDQATNFEFHCPECGGLITQEDNSKKIENIKKEIQEIKKEIK